MYLVKGCFISSMINSSSVFKSFELKIQVPFKSLVAFAHYNFYVIQVNTEYPKTIDCSGEKMEKELKEAFGALGRLLLTEINAAEFEKRQTDQLKTFRKFLSNHVL